MSVFANKLSGFILLLVAGILASQFQPASAQSSVDAVIHFVEGTPSDTDISYNVNAYVSVVDGAGSPVNGLIAGDFTLVEDSQQVEIGGVSAADEPISLVLLIDTSGSMSGSGITAAKSAAASFVTSLGAEDRVAVVTFNDTIATVMDFTTDHQSTRDRLSLIDATRGAGTCLYDAAYQAIQMTATVPSGRRAVVLFTDGVDETASGGPCSANTADDVIKIATEGGTRTPVYTMGMGSKVDQNSLKRMATNTGGRFFYSPDPNNLDTIFRELSDSLRSQYLIEYSSQAGPGSHTLAVTVKSLGAQDTDTRSFLLPNFPLRLSFAEPAEGGEVTGQATVRAETFGQGETIESVVFQINGATVATVTSTPYEAQIDFSSYPAGALTIEVIAQGAGGIELARASRSVEVIPGEAVVVVENDPLKFVTDNLVFILGGLLLLGVAIVFGAVMFVRKQNENRREREWKEKVEGVGELTSEESSGGSDRTVDSWEMPSDAYGRLTVLASDEDSVVNQYFDILKDRITLGRKVDNDIVLPKKDQAVSRHHAVIEERNGGLILRQVMDKDESGHDKFPTYGTYVNENQLRNDEEIILKNGDEIRLGRRLKLRLEVGSRLGDDKTYDQFSDDSMETKME